MKHGQELEGPEQDEQQAQELWCEGTACSDKIEPPEAATWIDDKAYCAGCVAYMRDMEYLHPDSRRADIAGRWGF